MTRHGKGNVHEGRKGLGIMKRYTLAIATVLALCLATEKVHAQEILLEGPLAGAPAVRKLVLYREMRFSVGPQFAYTILNDYMHNFLLGGRIEFNIFDWLSIGAVGYYAFNVTTALTDHITSSRDIGGSPTTPAESNYPSYTGSGNFKNQVALLKGMYLGQISLIPLRGKVSMFEKLFLALDGYIFLGGGAVQYDERQSCKGDGCGSWPNNILAPKRVSQFGGTFTAGVGFMAFWNEWLAVNVEYRLTPFKWNAGGTDEAGQSGTQWQRTRKSDGTYTWTTTNKSGGDYPDGNIDENDRTWNMNQSIALGVIFYFPLEPSIAE
jgi:outer membrane beta-barrel protein